VKFQPSWSGVQLALRAGGLCRPRSLPASFLFAIAQPRLKLDTNPIYAFLPASSVTDSSIGKPSHLDCAVPFFGQPILGQRVLRGARQFSSSPDGRGAEPLGDTEPSGSSLLRWLNCPFKLVRGPRERSKGRAG